MKDPMKRMIDFDNEMENFDKEWEKAKRNNELSKVLGVLIISVVLFELLF